MVCQKLLKEALPRMDGLKIEDVRIGLGYTALKNSAGGVGLAYTLKSRLHPHCTTLEMAGELKGRDLKEIAYLFLDERNVLKTALGLAAINSVAETDSDSLLTGDTINHLDIQKEDWVGMIGHFAPLEKRIKKITPHLFIIEDKVEYRRNGMYKIFDEILNSCDVVIITATTLINKTFEDIIKKTPKARKRVLLGPSTPLYAKAFQDSGIDILSGMVVEDKDKVLDIVSQGGGTMIFKNYCKKVNLLVKE